MADNNNKYLSLSGLSTFWEEVKKYINNADANISVKIKDDAQYIDITPSDTAAREFTVSDTGLVSKLAAIDQTIIDNEKVTSEALTDLDTRVTANTTAVTTLTGTGEGSVSKAVLDAKASIIGDAGADYDTLGKLEDQIQKVASDLSGALGGGGNVATQITAAIEALDVDDAAVAGEYVSSVSETDGKIAVTRTKLPVVKVVGPNTGHVTVTSAVADHETTYTIATDDIASAQALTNLTGRVTDNETAIAALASATHFLGVKDSLDDVTDPKAGDIVIVGDKEYVYDTTKGWVELGDTTSETQRIGALESAVGTLNGDASTDGSVAKAVSDMATTLRGEISNATTDVKVGITGSTLVEANVDAAGRNITLTDSTKLTNAVAAAETAIQTINGSTNGNAVVNVAGDGTTKTIGVTLTEADSVAAGGTGLTTAEKVKAYVESKLNAVAHDTDAVDADVTKVVTGIVNREDGTGFDVKYTNFTPIPDSDITALFAV